MLELLLLLLINRHFIFICSLFINIITLRSLKIVPLIGQVGGVYEARSHSFGLLSGLLVRKVDVQLEEMLNTVAIAFPFHLIAVWFSFDSFL
jgi:hypothetical protein